MPYKTKTPAVKERLRENQRACRVRQKELIEDLRRRVRELEERDAQATGEMQRAARAVEWENSRLRALLSSRGISAEEIHNFLRSESGPSPARQQCTEAPKPRQSVGSQLCSRSSQTSPTFTGDTEDVDSITETPPQAESNVMHAAKPAAMVTLCDRAAEIIAEAHGHGDTEAALDALGCSRNRQDCVVNNVRIFDLIEQTL